jgi:NADPH:quinone reductase-like Zn-dependent oxidoreductase
MKAIICPRYGSPDVLQLREVTKPVPQQDEVLIKIHAASLNARDLRMLRANPIFIRLMPGSLFRPKNNILGADFAGHVETVGQDVRKFKQGDEVFGYMPSETRRGTLAEYVCAREKFIAPKPVNLTFEQTAAVPLAAVTALRGVRDKGNLQPGQKVLIYGASGGVGTYAVQIAKALGAEVTAVCGTRNMELMHKLGADHVIDYKKEDFTQNDWQYDLILAVNGYRPLTDYLSVIKPGGSYVVAGGSMRQLIQAGTRGKQAEKASGWKIHVLSIEQNQQDLIFLKGLLETGKVVPVIDACYPLSKTAEAFRRFERVHPKGKIVITMIENHCAREEKNVGEASDTRYIAYCGNDCTQCPQYKRDCVEGCLGTACANYCNCCIVRLCNLERKSVNCAQCSEYPCQKLENQYMNMVNDGFAEWAVAARKVLEEIRQS